SRHDARERADRASPAGGARPREGPAAASVGRARQRARLGGTARRERGSDQYRRPVGVAELSDPPRPAVGANLVFALCAYDGRANTRFAPTGSCATVSAVCTRTVPADFPPDR